MEETHNLLVFEKHRKFISHSYIFAQKIRQWCGVSFFVFPLSPSQKSWRNGTNRGCGYAGAHTRGCWGKINFCHPFFWQNRTNKQIKKTCLWIKMTTKGIIFCGVVPTEHLALWLCISVAWVVFITYTWLHTGSACFPKTIAARRGVYSIFINLLPLKCPHMSCQEIPWSRLSMLAHRPPGYESTGKERFAATERL